MVLFEFLISAWPLLMLGALAVVFIRGGVNLRPHRIRGNGDYVRDVLRHEARHDMRGRGDIDFGNGGGNAGGTGSD